MRRYLPVTTGQPTCPLLLRLKTRTFSIAFFVRRGFAVAYGDAAKHTGVRLVVVLASVYVTAYSLALHGLCPLFRYSVTIVSAKKLKNIRVVTLHYISLHCIRFVI